MTDMKKISESVETVSIIKFGQASVKQRHPSFVMQLSRRGQHRRGTRLNCVAFFLKSIRLGGCSVADKKIRVLSGSLSEYETDGACLYRTGSFLTTKDKTPLNSDIIK